MTLEICGASCQFEVMLIDLDIAPALQDRIAAIAARSSLSASEVIADALENGHSLEWQEQFLDKVAVGIAAADRGEFASQAEMDLVLNKFARANGCRLDDPGACGPRSDTGFYRPGQPCCRLQVHL